MTIVAPPPQDAEAEQALLGSVLLGGRRALDDVSDLVRAESFWRSSHASIWRASVELLAAADQLDLVTLRRRLEERGELEAAGGTDALREVLVVVPTPANARAYAQIVHDRALERDVSFACSRLAGEARELRADESASAFAQRAASEVAAIAEGTGGRASRWIGQLLDAVRERMHSGGGPSWSPSIPDLARVVARFRSGELVVVAGRPGHGKTSLMRTLARDAAERGTVVVFSAEEGAEQFAGSLWAGVAGVPKDAVLDGRVSHEQDWERLDQAEPPLAALPILIDESPVLDLGAIQASARAYARRHGPLAAVVVDYLQLLSAGGRRQDNRALELGTLTRGLKLLARELQTTIFLGSQLSRASQHTGVVAARRPRLADLRDSGAIESDADVVLGVFSWWAEDRQAWNRGLVEVHALKQRMAPAGRAVVGMTGAMMFAASEARMRSYLEKADRGRSSSEEGSE